MLLLLTSAASPHRLPSQEGEALLREELQVSLHRTWRADNVTMVDGFANVPLDMLGASTAGTYRVDLTVFDTDGTQLFSDGWDRTLSERAAAYASAGSSLLEPFQFAVTPGQYEIQVRAYPTDAPDLGRMRSKRLEGFKSRPAASDLYLASSIKPLSAEADGGWSLTRGGFGINAAAVTTVVPDQPELYYYIEFYAGDEEGWSTAVTAEIANTEGRILYRTPPTPVEIDVGGVPFTGRLPLAGLPPGEYTLTMTAPRDSDTMRRTAPFVVVESAATVVSDDSPERRLFASLSDEEMDDTYGGIVVLLQGLERQSFESLPPDGRRRYLTEFFKARDPEPLEDGNSFLEEYTQRLMFIRTRLPGRIGTTAIKAWNTDMGRIYLRAGPPEDRVINHFPSSDEATSARGARSFGEPPYEIWAYRKDLGYVYLFIEEDRFDTWRLVYSTDPNANMREDWTQRVGVSALRDLRDNFGIQPRFRTGLDN